MVDAIGMYANINTDHACICIQDWFALHKSDIPQDFPTELVLESIERLMRFNVFTFGSRFFLQKNGTAMGTNVGCMYATIYYSYHEEKRLLRLPFVHFYRRLIDDAFVVIDDDSHKYTSLITIMNRYGPKDKRLKWEATKSGRTVNFLDLTVSINTEGEIETTTYQKPRNLYLY